MTAELTLAMTNGSKSVEVGAVTLRWRGGKVQCLMGKSDEIQSDDLLLRARQVLLLLDLLLYFDKTGRFA